MEKWSKIEDKVEFPSILENLKGEYEWINCEFIGNHLIECIFVATQTFVSVIQSQFLYGRVKNAKKWKFIFVDDEDYHRKGFYIDHGIATP